MRTHGGIAHSSANILDFSANINPLGMPDAVRNAIADSAAECVRYPDPHCTALVRALAESERIPASQIVCGNGAADLIYRIVHAFRPRRALICAPTFSEYAFALREAGSSVREYPLDLSRDGQPDDGFLSAVTAETDLVFLCTPNNPTGRRVRPELLEKTAEKCSRIGAFLVCDECFLRFSEDAARYSLRPYLNEHCIILNAFTKLFAMPGLRLGYALCGAPEAAERLRGTGQYWSVSVPAQAAGIAALRVPDWIPQTVRYVAAERQFLTESLRKAGVEVYESDANFLLVRAPSDFAAQMAQRGIALRKCGDFHGLTDRHFRIAVRTHEENLALISAITEAYK